MFFYRRLFLSKLFVGFVAFLVVAGRGFDREDNRGFFGVIGVRFDYEIFAFILDGWVDDSCPILFFRRSTFVWSSLVFDLAEIVAFIFGRLGCRFDFRGVTYRFDSFTSVLDSRSEGIVDLGVTVRNWFSSSILAFPFTVSVVALARFAFGTSGFRAGFLLVLIYYLSDVWFFFCFFGETFTVLIERFVSCFDPISKLI